ncbi:aromatic ring-hydroxylating dioxygenase subunit alpha [Aquicoccus porphyridii]|uniref:Aromatic ring-hydroxylating dioxygenase subunit alpha n=1 Tax=Aquicoccus porphyridii TaxID=1852029 RepID=A0A5A9YXP1_9RHOB|nr:aromatic ring-hydroxylating dioxygenase subunit alpha [Aquicoccus porphyridii]KAA0909763.1 aromatic ring-hydroxylating dioxygenase subunit alpha [Aquicoccus porphyridii]RAI52880.1 aromatic ring-hydroxylating dioxygenase subunit alpha [Rhodobacteraceae bacterium AsT-22]
MTTDLSTVIRPIASAHGLPNAHYTDPDVFAEERAALLFDEWAGLAVAADVPEPGDAKPVEFLGVPLLLLRGRDNLVRVFHNICRHRGMILVSEPRKIEGAIRCPYHSWCYAHDGRLVATPHVGGPGMNTHDGIDRDALGLVEVPSHIWRDVIFVNLNGNAAPFEDVHADLLNRWREFDSPHYHGGTDSRFTLKVNTNWKLAVENYCESYHLPWVHPGLNSYSRLEDHYHIEAPGCYSGQGTHVYRQIRGDDGTVFPDFPGLSRKWDAGAEYVALYPNVLFGAQRDHAFAIILEPVALDRTVEHVHLYYATPETDDALRAQNTAQWKQVFEEDVFVVEGMQKGRHTPGFDGGRFSPAMDGPTHLFHAWVAGKIATHRQQGLAAE